MQHDDPNDRAAGAGGTGGFGGAGLGGGMSGSPGGTGSGGMSGAGTGGAGNGGMGQGDGFDRVRETVRDRAHEAGEKADDFRHRFADRLHTGAERLRQRASGMSEGTGDSRLDQMLDTDAAHRIERGLASGMDSTADWLRHADAQSIRTDIENQVRNNPGRTLLIALGVGYLIGKAFGGTRRSGGEAPRASHQGKEFGGNPSTHGLH